ncbi:MAG: hypothetical protein ACW96N_06865 [Candidatus Thorarchaeota archaeon]|jgi:hypothetical protein
MSTRYTKTSNHEFDTAQGYEGASAPEDFTIPACTIEDVDKAVHKLFDKEIPLYYLIGKETRRIPVIFATGERFAILRRKQPLRDENSVVILPLISIMRTGVDQKPGIGNGPQQTLPQVIKRRLSKEDPRYQKVLNKLGFESQYDLESGASPGTTRAGSPKGVDGTRRRTFAIDGDLKNSGNVLRSRLNNNLVETIEIPPVKYYQATYEITVWTQYTTQMNDVLSAIMSSYTNMHQREFRLETDEGYWFVGYVDSAFSPGNNFDEFSTEERIIRYSFNLAVVAYLIEPDIPGRPVGIRSFVSAPTLDFVVEDTPALPLPVGGPVPGDVNAYVLQDLDAVDALLPGQAIGGSPEASAAMAATGESGTGAYRASSDARNPRSSEPPLQKSTSVGTTSSGPGTEIIRRTVVNEQTGERREVLVRVKGRNSRKGETVLRGEIGTTFDDIIS